MFALLDIGPSLDRALAAFNSPKLVATLDSLSKKGSAIEQSSATVSRSGSTWTVRLQSPPTSVNDRVDIFYRIGNDRIEGWNRLWNERLSLTIPAKNRQGPASSKLALATPLTLEAELLTSPTARKGTFDALRKVRTWKRNGNVWRALQNGQTVEVRFDGSGRWTGYSVSGKGESVKLTVRYPASAMAFAPSSTATVVRAFATPPTLPKGVDEGYLRSILAAHKHFRGVVNTPPATLTVTNQRVSEQRPGLSWQWSGGVLKATVNGQTKSAKTNLRGVIGELGKLTKEGPDVYLRDLTLGRIPFANVLAPGARAKILGQASSGGAACDILEVLSYSNRITLFVRKADHLVASATVEGLDKKGATIGRSLRTYAYKKI